MRDPDLYRQVSTTVQAIRYDGSDACALRISAAFPDRTTMAEGLLFVAADGRIVCVRDGWWVVEFVRFGILSVVDPTSWRIMALPETRDPR